MAHLDQIYDCLLTDPCFSRTTHLGYDYTPWNHPDPEKNRSKLSRTFTRSSQTVCSPRRMKSSRRSDSQLVQKYPLKGSNYIFQTRAAKHTSISSLNKSRISAPIIKQKRSLNLSERWEKELSKVSRFGILNCQYHDNSSLFLFKPKNPNPIEMRNRNIQLIRHLPRKRFFKSTCNESKCA